MAKTWVSGLLLVFTAEDIDNILLHSVSLSRGIHYPLTMTGTEARGLEMEINCYSNAPRRCQLYSSFGAAKRRSLFNCDEWVSLGKRVCVMFLNLIADKKVKMGLKGSSPRRCGDN